jgi:hypothetical protein
MLNFTMFSWNPCPAQKLCEMGGSVLQWLLRRQWLQQPKCAAAKFPPPLQTWMLN